jgi:hypothetical protein
MAGGGAAGGGADIALQDVGELFDEGFFWLAMRSMWWA